MFTGIITDIGELGSITPLDRGLGLKIYCHYAENSIDIGASIACNGVCLTVVSKEVLNLKGDFVTAFEVEAWDEALRLTTIKDWSLGQAINLERSLSLGHELGGHLVFGHVSGLCKIVDITPEGDAKRFLLEAPLEFMPFIVPKGSIALDGTSLTINHVNGQYFDVLIIDHTLKVTNWGQKEVGQFLNVEIDQLARYAAKQNLTKEKTKNLLLDKNHMSVMHADPIFLIVDACFYKHISQKLLTGAINVLKEQNIKYDHITVSGALEIPAIIAMAEKFEKNYSGYIALGCIIRGETYHFDIVANESARALMDLSIKGPLAIGNGILTVENEAQALARAQDDETNKGAFAAQAALKMAQYYKTFQKAQG